MKTGTHTQVPVPMTNPMTKNKLLNYLEVTKIVPIFAPET